MAKANSSKRRIRPRPPRSRAPDGPDVGGTGQVQGSPAQVSALLHQADAGTRESVTTQLQSQAGNAAVQRLVVQRDPPAPTRTPIAAGGSGTRTPIAAGGGETRTPIAVGGSVGRVPIAAGPRPSTEPPLDVRATSSAKWLAGKMHQQYVGETPTLTDSERAVVDGANDYFPSAPLEPHERSSGEHLQKRDELIEVFQRKAHQLTLHILSKSEEQAISEMMRYSDDPGTDNEAADQLRAAATHLARVQTELFEAARTSAMVQEAAGLHSVVGGTTATLDDDLDRLATQGAGPVPAADNYIDTEIADRKKNVLAIKARYTALRDAYGQGFPILLPRNQDYGVLANARPGEAATYATTKAKEVIKASYEFRDELDAEKIWSLPVIIDQTKKLMGIEPGSGANDALISKQNDIVEDKLVHSLGMAALQLGLSVLAGALTGGTSLAVQAAGAAAATGVAVVSGGQAVEGWRQYRFGKAAAGEISLDPAVRLASEEPSWGWVALDMAAMVVDVAEVASAFRTIRATMKAAKVAEGLKAAGKAAAAAAEVAAVAGEVQPTMTLAEVEEVVRAEASVLNQQGKLAPGMTEDLFVERLMSGLRRKVARSGAEVGEAQATVLAGVLDRSHPGYAALLAGDRNELTKLLVRHGEWKTLVTGLERGGQEAIAEHLVKLRQTVVEEVSRELREGHALEVRPMSGGSEERVSDIDLQISGEGSGRGMAAAEELMGRKLGDNWSEILRINFYTEGGRLTRYQEVLAGLGRAEQAAMTTRITKEAERLNFAKMLFHAGEDPAALARVEARAAARGVDLEPLRPLAAMDDSSRLARRNELLAKIDDLQAEYTAATDTRRVELAEEISMHQMEANFYTYEANIAPTSLGFSGIPGLAAEEAYQATLTQLEMIEHILSEAGGDIAVAAREYELFKYIARFAEAAEKGGHSSAALKYLKNHGLAVSGAQRDLMEETAHLFLGPGRRAGVTDVPQVAGAEAAVTNSFIYKQWDMFQKEAESTLHSLSPGAKPLAAGGGAAAAALDVVRGARVVASARGIDSPDTGVGTGYAERTINQTTPDRYLVMDRADPRLKVEAHLEGDGELNLDFRTSGGGARSEVLRDVEEFERVMLHFGSKAKSIRGSWSHGSELAALNKATQAGRTVEQAVIDTWTGARAADQGYSKVTVVTVEGRPGAYTTVVVRFLP